MRWDGRVYRRLPNAFSAAAPATQLALAMHVNAHSTAANRYSPCGTPTPRAPQHAMASFAIRVRCGRWQGGGEVGAALRLAHGLTVPLLSTPTTALGIQDAGTRSAAAFIFLHQPSRSVCVKSPSGPDKAACAGSAANGKFSLNRRDFVRWRDIEYDPRDNCASTPVTARVSACAVFAQSPSAFAWRRAISLKARCISINASVTSGSK